MTFITQLVFLSAIVHHCLITWYVFYYWHTILESYQADQKINL